MASNNPNQPNTPPAQPAPQPAPANTKQPGFFARHPRLTWGGAGLAGNAILENFNDYDDAEQQIIDNGQYNEIGDTAIGFTGIPGLVETAGTGIHILGNKTNSDSLKGLGFILSNPVTSVEMASDYWLGTHLMKRPEDIGLLESKLFNNAQPVQLAKDDPNLKYYSNYDPRYLRGFTEADARNGISIIPIITANGKYNSRDVLKFMGSIGMDSTNIGLSQLGNGKIGYALSPEFFKDFVLSKYFKGDRNTALKDLGIDPQQAYADQHTAETSGTTGNETIPDSITAKYMADWAAKKQAIEQGKWIPGKSDIQNGQLVNGDDSPTIAPHERNTVKQSDQPNIHKDNASNQYLQYLMYRDYQKDKQRAASQKDMGLIPLLLAAYGMAKIGR